MGISKILRYSEVFRKAAVSITPEEEDQLIELMNSERVNAEDFWPGNSTLHQDMRAVKSGVKPSGLIMGPTLVDREYFGHLGIGLEFLDIPQDPAQRDEAFWREFERIQDQNLHKLITTLTRFRLSYKIDDEQVKTTDGHNTVWKHVTYWKDDGLESLLNLPERVAVAPGRPFLHGILYGYKPQDIMLFLTTTFKKTPEEILQNLRAQLSSRIVDSFIKTLES